MITIDAAYAGNTGKIAGKVIDKQTDKPLFGANVIIKNTYLGAATSKDGSYYILQVPPGKYDMVISFIGYNTLTIREVRVEVDLTTHIDAYMESSAIETQSIEVVADNEMIQKDITSTRRITSREEMEVTPGMEQALDMIKLQAGTVLDAIPQIIKLGEGQQLQVRDESVKDVHIRGGRGGEILYIVDGVPVTHPIYGGRSVIDLNVNEVKKVELLTGAFNAEYGQAQSGVINITTRSGKDYFETGIEYRNDNVGSFGDSYDTRYMSLYLGGPGKLIKPIFRLLRLNFPGKINYFLSGNINLTNTPYNNNAMR
ncbi:MAG: hypothetical protein DRP89_03605, partial [Candidatus Neomarinimicrobiota bacterium]